MTGEKKGKVLSCVREVYKLQNEAVTGDRNPKHFLPEQFKF